MKNDTLIISHAHCSDGLSAAWVFYKTYPDATFVFAKYGDAPPDVNGKEVYILDFSYPRETLLKTNAQARGLLVLDHHKSAKEDLEDLLFCQFDMNRSGAGMAWDYLHPDKTRHWLIDYAEDRDLYTHKLLSTHEINATLHSYPLTFESLNALEDIEVDSDRWKNLVAEGTAILRAQNNMVDSIVKKAREVEICGNKVLMANTSVLQSEVGNRLAQGRPFGVAWQEVETGEGVYSLRSTKDGVDVSVIAKTKNGGGHKNAAGFKLAPGEKL